MHVRRLAYEGHAAAAMRFLAAQRLTSLVVLMFCNRRLCARLSDVNPDVTTAQEMPTLDVLVR